MIGTRKVGPGFPAYLIAEAGANHDRDLTVAHQLIEVAAEAKADAIKFQTYRAEGLYSRFAPRLSEMNAFERSPAGETPFELIRRIEMPWEWHRELRDHAVERGLDFLSTPFDLDAVALLADLGVKAFKIASYEITFYDLLEAAARHQRPMIVSTGNSVLTDVEAALNAIHATGNRHVIVLHCVSQYPARLADLHLRAMQTIAQAFDVCVGFSDHTLGTTAAVAAVGLGACCFEKHMTLSRARSGPDHPSALEPDELAAYVQAIRDAETALGLPIKRVQPCEEENHRLGRRSLHARIDIPKGRQIASEMLTVKRPALGIHPGLKHLVVGRIASRDIQADEWITWEML